jgi:hypothetical protein
MAPELLDATGPAGSNSCKESGRSRKGLFEEALHCACSSCLTPKAPPQDPTHCLPPLPPPPSPPRARLVKALEEAKRRLARAQKAAHAAEVAAAELRGKGDAEREAGRAEVRAASAARGGRGRFAKCKPYRLCDAATSVSLESSGRHGAEGNHTPGPSSSPTQAAAMRQQLDAAKAAAARADAELRDYKGRCVSFEGWVGRGACAAKTRLRCGRGEGGGNRTVPRSEVRRCRLLRAQPSQCNCAATERTTDRSPSRRSATALLRAKDAELLEARGGAPPGGGGGGGGGSGGAAAELEAARALLSEVGWPLAPWWGTKRRAAMRGGAGACLQPCSIDAPRAHTDAPPSRC